MSPIYVFSYLRVSGQGQVAGDGFPRQREAIAEYCARHGLTILGEFLEKGVSGTIEGLDRPAFAEMVDKAEQLTDFKIQGIVVENMDRWARTLIVGEVLLGQCRQRGLKVFCTTTGDLVDMADENIDDPHKKLYRQILGAIAEFEKCCMVNKLRGARRRKRMLGFGCEGAKPYGQKPGEGDILREMRALKERSFNLEEIALELNVQGRKTRFGKKWNKSNVFVAMGGKRIKKVDPLCAVPTLNTSVNAASPVAAPVAAQPVASPTP